MQDGSSVASTHRLENVPVISLEAIQAEALSGRFYNHASHQWEEMGRLEWLIRTIFNKILFLCDSVSKVCERHSWTSIAQMNEIPEAIASNINNYFLDSRDRYHPLNEFSHAITNIYAQTICNKSPRDDVYPVQRVIQLHQVTNMYARSLRMFKNTCSRRRRTYRYLC